MTRFCPTPMVVYFAICLVGLTSPDCRGESEKPFQIEVVDEATGRGVPLVELETVQAVRYFTDSAGRVAFHEPALMNQEVYFAVQSHGYEFAKDGFGFQGTRLRTVPGGKATLKIKRLNIAERLYRVTGGGIYRDSVLLGEKTPLAEPLLNGQVVGSDSVVNAVFRGKLYWFWGDTNRPAYPLGLFDVPGATSNLPAAGGLDPAVGVDLTYFVGRDGFVRPMCKMSGPGPTWIEGLVVVKDKEVERMFASYMKIKAPLTIYERGVAEFKDATAGAKEPGAYPRFEQVLKFPEKAAVFPGGHPVHHVDGGVEYVYFAKPYPLTRVRATVSALLDLAQYETWTYLKPGDQSVVERDAAGNAVLGWKRGAPPLDRELEKKLFDEKKLKTAEQFFIMSDVAGTQNVTVHNGSCNWNAYRKRWVMIFTEHFGKSALGEIWYAEAKSPTGPWQHARKIVTHDKYSFYNPKHHSMFDQKGGRIIYFEGTYTHTFSGNSERTPRYDYNQIMYRLDLADQRLLLPPDE